MDNQTHPQDNGQYHIPPWTTSASPHVPLSTVTDQQQLLILQNLLGINTSTSRNHQHIMAEALAALKSCNDTELLLKKKASYSYSSNMVQEHPQYTRNHHWTSARRLHQLGGEENTKIAASQNNHHDAMVGAMNTSSPELLSLQNDHPTLALLGSIISTQEPGLTNYLHHHHQAVDRNIIRKENTLAANEEDMRNMAPLAHYLQQSRLRAKAEARLRLMRAQQRSSGEPETKRQRCDDLAGISPPSVSVGSVEGRGESIPEARVDTEVGVVDRSSTQRSRPFLNDSASSSSLLEKASLLVHEVELEARKHYKGIVIPPNPLPQSPQRPPGPVRRASAA